MRIAPVSTLWTLVRQEGTGSVEELVWLLDRELTCLGHETTVFLTSCLKQWRHFVPSWRVRLRHSSAFNMNTSGTRITR